MSEYQKVLKSSILIKMKADLLSNKNIEQYFEKQFNLEAGVLISSKKRMSPGKVVLKMPSVFKVLRSYSDIEFENAKRIFEAYPDLTPEDASDERFWTYLTHVEFWNYMQARTNLQKNKNGKYILTHWFVDPVGPQSITRNDIARLWWGAFLTYDKDRPNPYELTKQLFSMQDYTRTLIGGFQGRNPAVLHGVLEFVIENDSLFKQSKEEKIRLIMKKINRIGGHLVLSLLTKERIKQILDDYKKELENVSSKKL